MTISLPEASSTCACPSTDSIASTFSRSRNVTLVRRSRYWNASPISPSRKSERAVALIDDRDLGAERAEHRGVLDADHARADDGHRARHAPLQLQQPVGVDDRAVVEGDGVRARRLGADRDHDALGADRLVGALDPDGVVVLERGVARQPADHVAAELLPHDRGLGAASRARRGPSAAGAPCCSVSSMRVGSSTSSGRSASWSSTASRSVLDGIVPVWMETPPRRSRRSATATRLPSLAAWMAAF